MKCSCGSPDTKVIDTTTSPTLNVIRRRRECNKCGRRFTTIEISKDDIDSLLVVEQAVRSIEAEAKEIEQRKIVLRKNKKDVQKIRNQIYGKYKTMLDKHEQALEVR